MTGDAGGGVTPAPEEALQTAVKILRRYGRNGTAALAERRFRDTLRVRRVVVVGEVKRGKSSLVNALTGRRGLVPVGVGLCTSAPIRVFTQAGEVDESTVTLHRAGGTREVPRTELTDWVRFGEGHVAEAGEDLPSAVSLDIGSSPLPDVTVIDTPGVGGLDEGAIRLALHECRNAGVLVMVCDASTPITAPEMDVLRRVKDEGGAVVVAVTKSDKNLRRWRDVVAEDRRLIAEHLGREVPVIGVSSLRALDAVDLARTDPERARRIEESSGIAALRRAIVDALALGDALPRLAGLRAAQDGLRHVLGVVDKDIEVAGRGADLLPELEARRAELKELREHGQEWEHYMQRSLTLDRTETLKRLDAELEELQQRWGETIRNLGIRTLSTRPQVFTAQIEAEMTEVMQRAVGSTLESLERETMRLFDDPAQWSSVAAFAMETLAPPEVKGKAVGKRTENLLDPSLATMGVIGAGMLSTIIPLAPVAGAAWIAVNIGYRAMRNGRTALLSWLRETCHTTRTATARMIDATTAAVRPELVLRYRAHLRDEVEEVTARIEEAKASAKRGEAERKATMERLRKNRVIVEKVSKRLDDAIATVRAEAGETARAAGAPAAAQAAAVQAQGAAR